MSPASTSKHPPQPAPVGPEGVPPAPPATGTVTQGPLPVVAGRSPEWTAAVQSRLADGTYLSEVVAAVVARRILDAGDL